MRSKKKKIFIGRNRNNQRPILKINKYLKKGREGKWEGKTKGRKKGSQKAILETGNP